MNLTNLWRKEIQGCSALARFREVHRGRMNVHISSRVARSARVARDVVVSFLDAAFFYYRWRI